MFRRSNCFYQRRKHLRLSVQEEDQAMAFHHGKIRPDLSVVSKRTVMAEGCVSREKPYQQFEDYLQTIPERAVRRQDWTEQSCREDFQGKRNARREAMLRGLTPLKMRQLNRDPARDDRWAETPEAEQEADTGRATGNSGCGDDASFDNGTPSGLEQASSGSHPPGSWAEEIRIKDELISTLKRQLSALGEQPMDEVVTLEVGHDRDWPTANARSVVVRLCGFLGPPLLAQMRLLL